MALGIKIIKLNNDIYSFELKGSIDTDSYMSLEDEFNRTIEEKASAVIFDMGSVSYISSIGIRVIISAKKALETRQATFAMVNLQPQVRKVLDIMKLLPLFEIFDNTVDAVRRAEQIMMEETR